MHIVRMEDRDSSEDGACLLSAEVKVDSADAQDFTCCEASGDYTYFRRLLSAFAEIRSSSFFCLRFFFLV